jgi:glyoxylase-like metal-dependent hydrolase (beta-lactamase superfamily II)
MSFMSEEIQIGSVAVAVARDSYWEGAPADHLRDLENREIPLEQFGPVMPGQDPKATIRSRVLTFVVKSRGKTILLDAGVGGWGLWRFGDGHLLDSLRDLDVSPEEIDYVIPSHLHLDHIGWNTHPDADGKPVITFPNARHLFHKADWVHFTNPSLYQQDGPESRLFRTVSNCLLPVEVAGLMELVDHEMAVTDEVTILHTPGHTPGSVSILVQSGGESALFIGDLVHLCMQLTAPEWSPPYENDRQASASSRRRIVEEAIGRNALVAGSHLDEGPIYGRMVTLDGRRFWQGVGS